MKNYIRCLFIVLLIIGCNNMKAPISSEVARAWSQTNHNVSIKSYEIPEGVFRGALWPSPNKGNFQIWLIDGGKEIFYDITAPSGFNEYEKETTEDWNFKLLDSTADKQTFVASKKDNSKSVKIELPLKKRKYSLNALKNMQGDELIIFMDISETVRDKGLFGYAIIKSST